MAESNWHGRGGGLAEARGSGRHGPGVAERPRRFLFIAILKPELKPEQGNPKMFFMNIRVVPAANVNHKYSVIGTDAATKETRRLYSCRNWRNCQTVASALQTMQAENKILITG